MSALRLRDVSLMRDQNKVLDALNMTVNMGSIYCIMGSSSVGKTTLISCILNLLPLDGGEVQLFDRKIDFKRVNHLIGYMPQFFNLPFYLTVKETIKFYADIYCVTENAFKSRYEMLERIFELPSSEKITILSGGEKRRVVLATAFIHNPMLVFLDEPTVGLDPVMREKVWNFFRELVSEFRSTIVLSTHYIYEASISDKVGFLKNGKFILESTPKKVMEKMQKATLSEAFDELYQRKFYEKVEDTSVDEVAVELPNKLSYPMLGMAPIFKKEFRLISRYLFFSFLIFSMPVICIWLYMMAFGDPLKNQTIALVSNSSVNCSLEFQLQCFVTQELKNLKMFNLRYFDDIKSATMGQKKENFIAVIEFPNSNVFNCDNSYEVLSPLEMESPNLLIRANAENIIMMDATKSILMGVYHNVTKKVFEKCNLIGYENLMTLSEIKDTQLSTAFNFGQLQLIITLTLMTGGSYYMFGAIILGRNDGTFRVCQLAGVPLINIYATYFLFYFFMAFGQLLTINAFYCLIFKCLPLETNLVFLMTIFYSLTRGTLMGTLTTNMNLCSILFLSQFIFDTFTCGLIRPFECLRHWLQQIVILMPIYLPGKAADQCYNRTSMCIPTLIKSFAIQISWILLTIVIIVIFRKKTL